MTIRSTALLSFVALLFEAALVTWIFLRPGNGPARIDTSRAAVIKEMRELGRLESASFTIEKIIEARRDGGESAWSDVLFGDKLLLIAHGDVVAGIDLYGLNENAITVSGSHITVALPAPKILSVTLDNAQTRVYDRSQGILSRGDKDLESEARQAAETEIRAAACQAAILNAAAENGAKQIKALLGAAGFADVSVTVAEGSC